MFCSLTAEEVGRPRAGLHLFVPNEWHSIYFNTVYPTYTVAASTAAHMLATFPLCQPDCAPFTAQKWRNDQAIELLAQNPQVCSVQMRAEAVVNPVARGFANIKLESFPFVYSKVASFSWQLAPEERDRIRCAANDDDIRKWAGLLCAAFYTARQHIK